MKPKNKFQERIVEAGKSLPAITKQQIQWGYDNAIEHFGLRTSKGIINCTRCGHSWQEEGVLSNSLLGCDCPNCHTKLKVKSTKKRVYDERYYMTIVTAHKGYQVLRTIMLQYYGKIGESPTYTHLEAMQRWIAPDGKHATFALLRQNMGTCYIDLWIRNSSLELRDENTKNKFYVNIYDRIGMGEVYPRIKLIPELKRTGFKKRFYGQKPLNLFQTLLKDSRAETLIKAGYTKVLERIMDNGWKQNIDNYWASIRICIRNGYKIKDAILWCDYIDMLRFFGKDLRNAQYVSPTDLKAEHDRYAIKRAKVEAQQEIEKQPEKEAEFRQAKEKFFGLAFSDGKISVHVLESVAEIIEEGKVMHHCVGSYHSKTNSLILSACVDGKKIETIEVSLTKLRVIQSKGVCNKNTPFHSQIINLVEQNMPLIEQRLAA